MSLFRPHNGQVWMLGNHKPLPLPESMVEGLLDLFQTHHEVSAFNELADAHEEATGIGRVSGLRVA